MCSFESVFQNAQAVCGWAMARKKQKMIGVDLFAGAGGLSLGAQMAGVDVKLAIESDEHAAATYKHNHPETEVMVSGEGSLGRGVASKDSRNGGSGGVGPPVFASGFGQARQAIPEHQRLT